MWLALSHPAEYYCNSAVVCLHAADGAVAAVLADAAVAVVADGQLGEGGIKHWVVFEAWVVGQWEACLASEKFHSKPQTISYSTEFNRIYTGPIVQTAISLL